MKAKARREAVDLAVGVRLKAVREAAGLSQRELAKRAGVTNGTVSMIEQEAHAPSLASLHRILTAIPISLADFFALPTSRRDVLFYDAADLAVVSRGAADLRVLGSERREEIPASVRSSPPKRSSKPALKSKPPRPEPCSKAA